MITPPALDVDVDIDYFDEPDVLEVKNFQAAQEQQHQHQQHHQQKVVVKNQIKIKDYIKAEIKTLNLKENIDK